MASELRVDKIIPATGVPTGGGGGIIQIQQTVKTDTWAGDSANNYPAFEEVTGLNVSITPKFSTSKLLVTASVNYSTAYWQGYGQLWRGIGGATRSVLNAATGDAAGSRNRATLSLQDQFYSSSNSNTYGPHQGQVIHLDSPATTSAVTYGLYHVEADNDGNALYINRSAGDADSYNHNRVTSSITLMEICG